MALINSIKKTFCTVVASAVALTAAGSMLTGCMLTDMKKNMDEMHDSTVSMAKTTPQKMDETKARMDDMAEGQGKILTAQMRLTLLDQIDKEENIGAKLALATAYSYSFEFQAYDPDLHSDFMIGRILEDSVNEFLESMHSFIHKRTKLNPTSQKNDQLTLFAIAAAMHKVNPLQEEQAAKKGFKVRTLSSLLEDIIAAEQAIKNSEISSTSVPAYVNKGLILIGDVHYMLRLRHNYLNTFSFGLMMSDKEGDEASTLTLAWRLINSGMFNKKWKPENLNIKNANQIAYYSLILETSLKTRDALIKSGVDLKTDKKIMKIYKNMDLSDFSDEAKEGEKLVDKDIREAMIRYKKATSALIEG